MKTILEEQKNKFDIFLKKSTDQVAVFGDYSAVVNRKSAKSFLHSSNISVALETLRVVKEKIGEQSPIVIGEKIVRVDSIQKAVDTEDQEYLDTCRIYGLLSSLEEEIKELK